ncbi:glycosyltransferase family 4 protein [Demequina aurantiaca]|uniref:glycosyltransferase family 4 protein n=1 Tax=Demequina aurantiaca TaxID=676200 RepID=UPI0007848827|nr:glycosyltransferase family 4 protein [Demequina aurantiaca]
METITHTAADASAPIAGAASLPGVADAEEKFPVATSVAFFVENRNAVRIVARLAAALDPATEVSLVTADAGGLISAWVAEEWASHPGLPVVENVLDARPHVAAADLGEVITRELRRWIENRGVDRVVLFNDQSVRGRCVVRAAHPTAAVVLIQDGTLEFESRVMSLGRQDQNWYYGTSGVDRVCVWGTQGRQRLLGKLAEAGTVPEVRVTGSVMHSADVQLAGAYEHKEDLRRRGDAREPLDVLIMDQPLAGQRKTSRGAHRNALKALVSVVERGDRVTIKPHPSSDDSHLRFLESLPRVTVLGPGVTLGDSHLREFDVALTWFSTSYLDTLAAGVPMVFVGIPDVNVVMPQLKSELLRNTYSVDEALEVLTEFRERGVFRANAAGIVPDALLRMNADVEADVVAAIIDAVIEAPVDDARAHVALSPHPKHAGTDGAVAPVVPHATRRARALADLARPPAPTVRIAVLGERFIQRVGVSLPIMAFARHLAATGQGEVRLIDVMQYASVSDVLAELDADEIVIINSLRPFWVKPWMSTLVERLRGAGRTPFVYAHETRAVVEREHAAFRSSHAAMLEALPGAVMLCVSDAQRQMFTEMGIPTSRTIFNTSAGVVDRPREVAPIRERSSVVMVGSVQARKGATLFSQVAELAAERGLDIDFTWVGGGNPTPELFLSDRVNWTGHLSRAGTEAALDSSDVFFLSSIDDPMPLSALEAIAARRRVVSYSGVGTHEIMAGVPGYESFADYRPEAALDAIMRVLETEPDQAAFGEVVDMFSAEAFSERLLAVVRAEGASAFAALTDAPASGIAGGAVPIREISRAVRAERFHEARVLSRQLARSNPTPGGMRALAAAWLAGGERDYALALLRTGYLLADNDETFKTAVAVDFSRFGINARELDRWTLRNATQRAWRRVRPHVSRRR